MTNLRYRVHEGGLGVTVLHADLAAALSAQHCLQIRDLLNRYRVVIFPDQSLTDEQLGEAAFRFGPPFVPDHRTPVLGSAEGASALVVVGNQAGEYENPYLGHQEVLPHSDHQWLRCPSAASMLYAVDIGPGSAPTVWTDMVRTYAGLDREIRDAIEDLRLITYNPFFRPFGTVRANYVDRRAGIPPGRTWAHPLVRTHPETRERSLYLHAAYEMELVGMPFDEGAGLIGTLLEQVTSQTGTYVHHWRDGDLVLWDNQVTIHYRPPFDPAVRRVLKRISIGGGIPF